MSKKIYHHGNVITVNDASPKAEAVLVEDGKIVAVGSNEDILAQQDGAELIDLQGKTMLPGFYDSHSHITFSYMFPKFETSPIGNVNSREDLVREAKAYLAANPVPEGEWFVGMGYDNAVYPDGIHPTIEDMDNISTDIPIIMMHTSGHVGMVNHKLLEVMNITKDTPNPNGGIIQKDPVTGEPTGMLEELALTKMVMANMPLPSGESMMRAVIRSQDIYASYGVTTAQDGSFGTEILPLIQAMQAQNMMKMDMYVYPQYINDLELIKTIKDYPAKYNNHFKLAGVKYFLDGSPQAKTAWLTQPYYVAPEGEEASYKGYPVVKNDEDVYNVMKQCLENRWQILVHCNGDAAMDQYINMYAKAQKDTGVTDDLRPIMIHCQTIRDDQLDKMKEIGMMPSFFHDHVFFWGDWHLSSVLGPERGRRISPLKTALEKGIIFTIHQDTPVVPPNMVFSIHNAVNRVTKDGQKIGEEFAIEPYEAIKAVTINAAYQYFDEDRKGTIEPGKLADFVLLDKDPMTVPKETIKDIQVLETIKEGNTIFQKK